MSINFNSDSNPVNEVKFNSNDVKVVKLNDTVVWSKPISLKIINTDCVSYFPPNYNFSPMSGVTYEDIVTNKLTLTRTKGLNSDPNSNSSEIFNIYGQDLSNSTGQRN